MAAGNINVGIVGYGYAGKYFHAYLVNLEKDLNLYAVSTRDSGRREAARRDYKVKTYPVIDELLADPQVDLVVIATPHNTHAELAIQAMEAGKDVVVDKIMCMNTTEADAMIQTSQRNNVLLSVFHNRRWDGDFLTVKKTVKSGLLGKPFLFESAVMRYGPPGDWRAQKSCSGGILFDWGAHLVDQALLLVDSPASSVFCETYKGYWDTDIENHLKLLIRFQNDVLFVIELSHLARIVKPRWYVLGDKGGLVKYGLDPQEKAMVAGDIDAAREDPRSQARVNTVVDGMPAEMTLGTVYGNWKVYYRNIADVLLRGAELAVKPQEVRRAMVVIDAAMESAQRGQRVKLT